MPVKQHPMEIAKGDTVKQRDLIVVKPITYDDKGNERPLEPFDRKTASGSKYKIGRVQIYDVATGQALNYMTGTNSKGQPIGKTGKIVGSQQNVSVLNALNRALEGPDAIVYHSKSNPNGAGTRAVGIKSDVFINDKDPKTGVDRAGGHLNNRVPEGGFQSFAVTPEQVANAYSSSAKFQIVNAFAGRAYGEAVKAGKSPAEAKAISQIAQASDSVRHGIPFIKAPQVIEPAEGETLTAEQVEHNKVAQQVQDILSGKVEPVPAGVSVPSIAAKQAANAAKGVEANTPAAPAPAAEAPAAEPAKSAAAPDTPLPAALPAPTGPGVEDDGFEM